ncbi:MAG: hypothetical protein U9R08_03545 [Nanoarchaeota archaeon]|nr:hypothetical protein [Nanoarchaeota archaeon]
MKTKLTIEIETPDKFEISVLDGEKKPTEEEGVTFAKDWHKEVVDFFKGLNSKDVDDIIELHFRESYFEEYYNEDGELPEHKIIVSQKNDTEKTDEIS